LKGQAEEKYPFCAGASLLFSSFASCDTILKNNLSEGEKKERAFNSRIESGRDIRLMYRVLSTFE